MESTFYSSHKLVYGSATNMHDVKDKSIHLVVTSPPYPMIEMWDACFNEAATYSIAHNRPNVAYCYMHQELEKVWAEIGRVVIDGGIVCVNMGDATRTIGGNFKLYPNHSSIIEWFVHKGFDGLPPIIWRKSTTAPNKFMGSGMLPCGAYVTQEHEYILIFRKQGKREFRTVAEKQLRRESAYFWPERNLWFSDIWDIKGERQEKTNIARKRSATYPLEIPYRLINMFSCYGDTVLDPFMGLGTTNMAAITCGRNSVGYEIVQDVCQAATENIFNIGIMHERIAKRIQDYKNIWPKLMAKREGKKCYFNEHLNVPVMTKQETDLKLYKVDNIETNGHYVLASHSEICGIT